MYEVEIARGVAALDQHSPGWRDRVRPVELDMYMTELCVVGQALGLGRQEFEYRDALVRLGATSLNSEQWAESHGFEAGLVVDPTDPEGDRVSDWDQLKAEWQAYLRGELELPPVEEPA